MTVAAPTRPRSVIGLLATAANFPIVFVGILVITTQAAGDDEVALLNLWALWGFLQALLGQVGLVTAAIDRLPWTSPAILRRAIGFGVLTLLAVAPFRDRLFPTHGTWTVAVAIAAVAVFLIGRLRGTSALTGDGVATVVVTACENLLRTALLVVFVLGDRVGLAALAIVAPFVFSLGALHLRTSARNEPSPADAGPALLWSGVIAGLPAVSAYAIVPGLTLLSRVEDLDAIAVATSLLRGPLLVATFASAWILQSVAAGRGLLTRLTTILPLLLIGHLAVEATDPSVRTGLLLHGVLSGLALMGSYLSALADISQLDRLGGWGSAVAAASIVIFGILLVASGPVSLLHPFVALTAVAVLVAIAAHVRPSNAGVLS